MEEGDVDAADEEDLFKLERETLMNKTGKFDSVPMERMGNSKAERRPARKRTGPSSSGGEFVQLDEQDPASESSVDRSALEKHANEVAARTTVRQYFDAIQMAGSVDRQWAMVVFLLFLSMGIALAGAFFAAINWAAWFVLLPIFISVIAAFIAIVIALRPFGIHHWAMDTVVFLIPLAFATWEVGYGIVYLGSSIMCQKGDMAYCDTEYSYDQIGAAAIVDLVAGVLMAIAAIGMLSASTESRESQKQNEALALQTKQAVDKMSKDHQK